MSQKVIMMDTAAMLSAKATDVFPVVGNAELEEPLPVFPPGPAFPVMVALRAAESAMERECLHYR